MCVEEIPNRLRRLSPEEERLLRGEEVRREDYGRTEGDFCVESGQLMPSGGIESLVRPHTPVCRLSTAPAQLCGNDVHGSRGDPAPD